MDLGLTEGMRPLLVIDAANVVGAVPDGWWRSRARATELLRDALAPIAASALPVASVPQSLAWLTRPPIEVVLVVEGAAAGVDGTDAVRVVAAEDSGDEAIVALVSREGRDRLRAVVTRDRELRARVGGARGGHRESGRAAAPVAAPAAAEEEAERMIRTSFTDMFGLDFPVALAPMAGVAGGHLAAAVSNAGGLGLVGGGYGDPGWVAREASLAAREARRPWGVGFITWHLDAGVLELALRHRPPPERAWI